MLDKIMLADEEYILSRYKTLLKKANILTVSDILYNFPSKYDDYTVTPHSEIVSLEQEHVVLEGTIASKANVSYLKSKMTSMVFTINIETKDKNINVRCTIFNRAFLKDKLKFGTVVRVIGKFYQNFNNFTVADLIIVDEINRDIVPVYKVKDLAQVKYFELIETIYRKYKNKITETLPKEILEKNSLMSLPDVVKKLHFPQKIEDTKEAYRRVKYEELLRYQLSMKYLHLMRETTKSTDVINYDEELINKLVNSLDYELTKDQVKVIGEILKDLKSSYPMNRLLQGEVGSGKTIVAFASILATCSAGYQAVLMCPTEILAKQHFESITEILKDFDCVKPILLTGSSKDKESIVNKIVNHEATVIIGTHAVFQKDVDYDKLGLVVADEEHRFGVRQRVLIKNKGLDVNYLKMSATPIPRTLAISAYGDTDFSVIKTMPANRKQVITKFVDSKDKKEVVTHMKEELKKGHQIYVVTPLIEESENLDTANATEIYENMKKYFSGLTEVGLVHGKLKTAEKDDVINKFLNKEIGILVATSVIEVGVNIPNATTIVILGAERFGVATLHQLRGRVMRSSEVPYCFLIPEKNTELSDKRLKMVEATTDGLTLAEYDLKHRGPGEFFGEKQSGSMNFKYADIRSDSDLLDIANQDSEELIKNEKLFNDQEYESLYNTIKQNYILKTQVID